MALERESPAKINLLLNPLGLRPDGFHEVETVLHPVPCSDRLRFDRAAADIHLSCNHPGLPTDDTNLVRRAAAAFLAAAGVGEGVRIHLDKHLPLAAGMGGGSSNAAITLQALNELFNSPLPPTRLHQLAAGLGSDVPFFLHGTPALATGRGEHIQPLPWFATLAEVWAFIVHPGFGISTPWAYQSLARFPEARNGQPGRAQSLVHQLQTRTLEECAAGFYNALQLPAFEKHPILVLYQEFLRAAGAPVCLMSGSGSAMFALVRGEPQAYRLREQFQARFGTGGWTAVVPLHPAPMG